MIGDAPPAATDGASQSLSHAYGFKTLRARAALPALLLTQSFQRLMAMVALLRALGAGMPMPLMAVQRTVPLLGPAAVLVLLFARLPAALVCAMPVILPRVRFLFQGSMRMLAPVAVWTMPALLARSVVLPAMRAA